MLADRLSTKDQAMSDDAQVIGYFAAASTNVFCDGAACVIAGTEDAMRRYIQQEGEAPAPYTIRKTRFRDIIKGIRLGAEYAFDEIAYNRFYPLARKRGLDLGPETFSAPDEWVRVVQDDLLA